MFEHMNFAKEKDDLRLIVLEGAEEIGKKVDEYIMEKSESNESSIVDMSQVRFSNGEGKININETLRGKNVFIISDVGNYSIEYTMYGRKTFKGPDEHFQDIKRTLSAINGKAKKITVIMPLLYASRQHRRKGRESLDCAMALQELQSMGVEYIITFDVHDPNIQNAIPLLSFDNIYPTYNIVRAMIEKDRDWFDDLENTIVISPDSGALDRAIYYAGVLGLNIGMFYKRRDYSKIVNGKNPIVAHEYVGSDIEGKNILIVDDMIASGESVLDIARELKGRGAKKVYIAATFALFTEGLAKFDDYYVKGFISRVYGTNLTYVPSEAKERPWYGNVDMTDMMGDLISLLNEDRSISECIDATPGIRALLKGIGKEI